MCEEFIFKARKLVWRRVDTLIEKKKMTAILSKFPILSIFFIFSN